MSDFSIKKGLYNFLVILDFNKCKYINLYDLSQKRYLRFTFKTTYMHVR